MILPRDPLISAGPAASSHLGQAHSTKPRYVGALHGWPRAENRCWRLQGHVPATSQGLCIPAKTDAVRSRLSFPINTQWHRDHRRGSHRVKATNQQLLTPREEQVVVNL
jgi:hypothetical protein